MLRKKKGLLGTTLLENKIVPMDKATFFQLSSGCVWCFSDKFYLAKPHSQTRENALTEFKVVVKNRH